MINLRVKKRLNAAGGEMLLDLDLTVERGQLITLYGPSGAGKTSTLRLLAGLMTPDNGSITVDGRDWFHTDRRINITPGERNIGFVFQDYALFPNMTVRENLLFARKKGDNAKWVTDLLDRMELGALAKQKPVHLSGGQKQRVALARALVQRPDILLLDEPLSALDAALRKRLRRHLLDVHKKFDLTTILVSHDPEDILILSDRVVDLAAGRIINQGSPQEVLFPQTASNSFSMVATIIAFKEKKEARIVIETMVTYPDWPSPLRLLEVEEAMTENWSVGDELIIIPNNDGLHITKVE